MPKTIKPSRVPVSKAYAEKRYHDGLDDGCRMLFACMAMTLRDFQGDHGEMLTNEDVKLIWERVQDRTLRLVTSRDSLAEYDKVLKEEYDIDWSDET